MIILPKDGTLHAKVSCEDRCARVASVAAVGVGVGDRYSQEPVPPRHSVVPGAQ